MQLSQTQPILLVLEMHHKKLEEVAQDILYAIVFPLQYAEKTYYIKRIIGLPGETIQIDDTGTIYINGEVLNENYGKETIKNPGIAAEPIHLGQNEYFVLGDNRNDSSDSRDPSVGNVYRKDIIGRAWFRFWPEFNKVE